MSWNRLLWLICWVWVSATATAAEAKRPNVIWLIGDDHAAHALGAGGSKLARTPNLDRFAATATRFDRAYCNSPVCTASRQSFLTGRRPRTIGVTQLRTALPEAELTLAEILAAHGHRTAAFGKMHFNSGLGHGFQTMVDAPQHRRWLAATTRAPLEAAGPNLPPWRPFADPARIWLNADCLPMPLRDGEMLSSFLTRGAVAYLEEAGKGPFFLILSLTEPHSPFHFPQEFRGRRKPSEFTPPATTPGDAWQIPAIFEDLGEEDIRGIQAAYHTSVEFLDLNMGRMLGAIERLGLMENTLICYFGDHGYLLGHHGRIEKHSGYEPAIRVPLLIRPPGGSPRVAATPALVELIDLAPTMLDYLGLPIPATMQGRSLRPVVEGRAKAHRERVFVEYSENEEAYVVTERHKLIVGTGERTREDGYKARNPRPGPHTALYDLREDPEELANLAETPEGKPIVAELMAALAGHLVETARVPRGRPERLDSPAALRPWLAPDDVSSAPAR